MTQLTLFLLQTCRSLDSFSTTESCAFVSFTALLGTVDKSVASHLVTDSFTPPAAMAENLLHFCFLPDSELLSDLFHADKSSVSCEELSAGSKGKK